jgi:hypothetical protein
MGDHNCKDLRGMRGRTGGLRGGGMNKDLESHLGFILNSNTTHCSAVGLECSLRPWGEVRSPSLVAVGKG